MTGGGAGPGPLLWTAAAAGWWWLFRNARSRGRLLRALSTREGGFLRRRFSWLLLFRETTDVAFTRVIGGEPVRFVVGYDLPFTGTGRAATRMAVHLTGRVLGDGRSGYGRGDLAGGRGLFVGGANLTAAYAAFAGELPSRASPVVRWHGSDLAVFIPALLGEGDQFWADRCLAFLSEAAGRVLASAPA